METVFEPDWRDRRRAEYTKGVATILSAIAGDGVSPTIQTAPLGFKPHVTPGVVERFTEHVLGVVAHLVELARTTGTTVRLGLEPEPFCHVETTEEAIRYFRDELFTDAAAARLATLAGVDDAEAAAALRAHLGVVFDICHQAVEFEDIGASLDALVAAGSPDRQAAGGGGDARPGGHPRDRRAAGPVHRDRVPEPDDGTPRRRADPPLPQPP